MKVLLFIAAFAMSFSAMAGNDDDKDKRGFAKTPLAYNAKADAQAAAEELAASIEDSEEFGVCENTGSKEVSNAGINAWTNEPKVVFVTDGAKESIYWQGMVSYKCRLVDND